MLQLMNTTQGRGPYARRPIRALILTPTRELAAQVEESVRTYGKRTSLTSAAIFGGVNINPQIQLMQKGVDILVATPGRLLDHLFQKTISLSSIEFLVLDEADRMLDMGFIRDIRRILAVLPAKRQNLLFSATFSDEIKSLADGFLNDPAIVEIGRRNEESALVTHKVYLSTKEGKRDLLVRLLADENVDQALVFTRTKHGADRLVRQLEQDGVSAVPIHGNRSQAQRTRALADFKAGVTRILVATDLAARGLDIEQLGHVFNYELPNVPEDYVHRIGRTGRANSPGDAISLVGPDEMKYLAAIEKLMNKKVPRHEVPAGSGVSKVRRAAPPVQTGGTIIAPPSPSHGRNRRSPAKPAVGGAQRAGADRRAAGSAPAHRRAPSDRLSPSRPRSPRVGDRP